MGQHIASEIKLRDLRIREQNSWQFMSDRKSVLFEIGSMDVLVENFGSLLTSWNTDIILELFHLIDPLILDIFWILD